MISLGVRVRRAQVPAEESAEKRPALCIVDAGCVCVPRARPTAFSVHSALSGRRDSLLGCLVSSTGGPGGCLLSKHNADSVEVGCLVSRPGGPSGGALSKRRGERSARFGESLGLLTKLSSKRLPEKLQLPSSGLL